MSRRDVSSCSATTLANRYIASVLAIFAIAFFSLYQIGDRPAGLALWRLFGTTNQLLAALTLLAVTLYLKQRGKNPLFTGIPMLFMLGTTLTAMVLNLRDFYMRWHEDGALLFVVGLVLLLLALWLVVEAVITLVRGSPTDAIRTGTDKLPSVPRCHCERCRMPPCGGWPRPRRRPFEARTWSPGSSAPLAR